MRTTISRAGLVAGLLVLLVTGLTNSQELKVRSDQASCPLLEGVFVSIMRRIFNPGYHKVKKIYINHKIFKLCSLPGPAVRG